MGLILVLINQGQKNLELSRILKNSDDVHIDTVYVDKPYKPEKELPIKVNPGKVKVYNTPDTNSVTDIQILHDTVFVSLSDSSTLRLSERFLTAYVHSSKLLDLSLSKRSLNLTLLNPNGLLLKKSFKIDTDRFKYTYINDNLTSKKLGFFSKFHPTVGVSFRPIHLMTDFNLGLKFIDHKVGYEVGASIFYYPSLMKNPGYDVYFKISYTL